jgi:hypothetical protein
MVLHLLVTLHEHEGTIGGETGFTLLVDQPALLFCVLNLAVISTDSFEFEFNITLVRSADVKASLLIGGFEEDLVLDHVAVLIGGDPGGAGSQYSLIIDLIVTVRAFHDNEILIAMRGGLQLMGKFVDMIVNNFSQVNQGSLMQL